MKYSSTLSLRGAIDILKYKFLGVTNPPSFPNSHRVAPRWLIRGHKRRSHGHTNHSSRGSRTGSRGGYY